MVPLKLVDVKWLVIVKVYVAFPVQLKDVASGMRVNRRKNVGFIVDCRL